MASANKIILQSSRKKLEYSKRFQNESSPDDSTTSIPIQVLFVKPRCSKLVSSQMLEAFELTVNENAEWIAEGDIDEIDSDAAKSAVFVCNDFCSQAFQKLKAKKFRIIGPQCLIMCIEKQKSIPRVQHPIFSATMIGLKVCCTSISRQYRNDLHERIQYMGGHVMKELTSLVTHLVCGEVGSNKYHVACKLGISVWLPSWVDECYKRCSTEPILATDAVFNKYRCPVFHGFNITVSNVEMSKRKEIQKLVTNNGGIYSGELHVDVTTHLILEHPSGCKFKAAKRKNIPCLTLDWIYDSIAKGFCLDHNLYLIKEDVPNEKVTQVQSSTPVKEEHEKVGGACNDLSAIDGMINETVLSKASTSIRPRERLVECDDTVKPEEWLSRVDLSAISKTGQFLDGCKILLSGFPPSTVETMIMILNFGEATRFSQLTGSVSHVVVGNRLETEHKKLLEDGVHSPYVVHLGWITESIRLGKPAEESSFSFQSPDFRFQMTITGVQNSSVSCQESGTRTLQSDSAAKVNSGKTFDTEMDDFINQYKETVSTTVGGDHQSSSTKLFHNLTFGVAGFGETDTDALKQLITENGGIFCENPVAVSSIDYGIVPIPACSLNFRCSHVATNYWLQNCVEEAVLLAIAEQPIYGPIDIDPSKKPLENCVICFTQFSLDEIKCLEHIASLLGAKCQDYFSRKDRPDRGLLANTHLLAKTAEGSKYEGAISWGVPVVSSKWLFDCLVDQTKLDEALYIVGKDNCVSIDSNGYVSSCAEVASSVKQDFKASVSAGKCVHSPSEKLVSTPLKTPVFPGWSTPHNDLFKTPSSQTCHLPNTAERFRALQSHLRSRYDFPCLHNNVVTELKKANADVSNSTLASGSSDTSAFETPCKSLNSEPRLNIREAMACLDTPERPEAKKVSPASLLSIGELFSLRVKQALHNEIKSSGSDKDVAGLDESIDDQSYLLSLRPLTGVVLAVSKKLVAEQSELNALAEKLGAKCKWIYEKACTHFVYQGKVNESSKELKKAKDDRKIIVSPEWIRACSKSHSRLDERTFPYTYNRNMSLQLTALCDTTPLRNSQRANDAESSSNGSSLACLSSKEADGSNGNQPPKTLDEAERREATNRGLDQIIAAAKKEKEKRKRGISKAGFSNISYNSDSVNESPIISRLNSNPQTDTSVECAVEIAESVPITWDDPSSRAEREKLTARLRQKTLNASLSNNSEDEMCDKSKSSPKQNEGRQNASPSSLKENEPHLRNPSSYVFMFTGAHNPDQQRWKSAIVRCGGRLIVSRDFDTQCTHVIMENPCRSEKFLAGVVSGCWLLHTSYLDECFKQGHFVQEEPYEWANESMQSRLHADDAMKLCRAAQKWRLEYQKIKGAQTVGPFINWKVILCIKKQTGDSFVRILKAGGATVLSTGPSLSSIDGGTHAFFDVCTSTEDLRRLVDAGIHCLKVGFISDYLAEGSSVNLKHFYLPEVVPLLNRCGSGESPLCKRKSDDNIELNKRKRHT